MPSLTVVFVCASSTGSFEFARMRRRDGAVVALLCENFQIEYLVGGPYLLTPSLDVLLYRKARQDFQ